MSGASCPLPEAILQYDSSVGGIAIGRLPELGGGCCKEAFKYIVSMGVTIRSSRFGRCKLSGRSKEARCREV